MLEELVLGKSLGGLGEGFGGGAEATPVGLRDDGAGVVIEGDVVGVPRVVIFARCRECWRPRWPANLPVRSRSAPTMVRSCGTPERTRPAMTV
ncbi:hypothetical protein GFS60_06732 (plasmid) [Rhodococcus sp. WAY2]|nr:hypothetical protein GFS60_06732 [Rhodococcus sp. WAY2]